MTRPLRCALAVAVGVAALTACTSAGSDSSTTKDHLQRLTVVLDWTPNTNHAGMYLARAKGWYRQAGLDVRFVEPGEAGALALLGAGKADVAVSVQEEVVPAVAQGVPVQAIAAIVQHNTSSLVSLASDRIEGPADLAGTTYGGYGGQLETALVDKLAQCGGAKPGSVKSVDVGEADYKVGLERNQYDEVWIFDGWDGIRLEQEGVDTNRIELADHTDCIPDWYTPVLATSTKVEQQRGPALRAFMAATARGYRAAMADPDASADALLASAKDLDPKLVRASARYLSTRYADDPAAWGRIDRAQWDGFASFLVDAGIVEKVTDHDPAWTNRYLPSS